MFNSRSLATAFNSWDPSASRSHVVTVRRISRNWTLVNCEMNYSAISSQPPLQNSFQLPTLNWTLSLTNQLLHFTSLHFTQLNCTQPRYIPNRKQSFYCCARARFRGNVLPSRCLETGWITPVCLCLHICSGRYRATTTVYRVTA
jgi:hypothetical protein